MRSLITEMISNRLPEFWPTRDTRRTHVFVRAPSSKLFAILSFQRSQKHGCISVDVVSSFFSVWDG